MAVPEIHVADLKRLLAQPDAPRLIDVRELEEWQICQIPGAELMPLSQWPALVGAQLTDPGQHLLIYCHHGGRSARAAEFLLQNGFSQVTNVAGGIDAWAREVDPALPQY